MSRVFVFDSIRAHLKARGMTYRNLADILSLSESSVKRIISSNDCTLERLEQICHCLQLDLSDLLNSTPRKRKLLNQLTWKQEEELTQNKELLVLAVCVMNLWSLEDVIQHLNISEVECVKHLGALERIGLIELQPANRYKLLVARHFSWIASGPIMTMVTGMADDYFDHHFNESVEILKIVNVRISRQAGEHLRRRLELIVQEYADQVATDSHLPLTERIPMSVCIAARTWVPEFMTQLLRSPESKKSIV
jgi:DNA-binding Xre family transcriptional regulator